MTEDQHNIPCKQSEDNSMLNDSAAFQKEFLLNLKELKAERGRYIGMQKKLQHDVELFYSKLDGIDYKYKQLHQKYFESQKDKISEIHAHVTHLSELIMDNSNPLNGYITNVEAEVRDTIDNTMHNINDSINALNLNTNDYKSSIDKKFSELIRDINATFGDLRISEDVHNSRRLCEIETIIEKSEKFLHQIH